MPYDYAPRLALLARARKRRRVLLTACLLMLPALSFHTARSSTPDTELRPVQLAKSAP